MTRPPEAGLLRFSRAVRWVHGVAGVLVLVLIVSAAVLYNSELQVLVGHRPVVEAVHVWSGVALPVPVLLGLASRSVRADAAELDRFTARDWQWLRSRTRRDGAIAVGKFNAGQKLNGSLSAGGGAVLLMTGAVMWLPDLTPLSWRTGATLVHDWTALAFGLLVLGHLSHALRDPVAMLGIRTGRVPVSWARSEHAAWAEELAGPAPDRRD
ncbi:cytochrome b/b6 domain-containing protein [Modestobacter sp. VKM Ac-2986]|uniref:cytochrome b/b6 domain-containing protein n=1 Tax=Modestobacter sp. VKM Ac-2986 TaxID=3004140 RepID=UPI0022AB7BB6|nr:cytochrome b/b6 domain-containing protein [Modestobacter sp. VKM Ac-2986]MCZ2830551.1 cytochrome b/b6 domain-containing protein [Modestobacter sp. VKM Ac-2986]